MDEEKEMEIETKMTEKGWFLWAPVYIGASAPDEDGKFDIAYTNRHWLTLPLLLTAQFIYEASCFLVYGVDPTFSPELPLFVIQ